MRSTLGTRCDSTLQDAPSLWRLVAGSFLGGLLMMHAPINASELGERVYKQVCIQCHGMGIDGAPKVGDRAAWTKLIAEGQIEITSDGYLGVRNMPARGGKPDLTLDQFAQAVVHMANKSGANWKDADPAMLLAIEKETQRRLQRRQKQAQK